uniref:hypothetical protein n=1 Tax=Pseudomonas aeruginosa TaxID=287 RepID=UPI002B415BFB
GTPADDERDSRAEGEIAGRFDTTWAERADLPVTAREVLRDADAAAFATRVLPALDLLDDVRVVTRGTVPAFRELRGDPALTITAVP